MRCRMRCASSMRPSCSNFATCRSSSSADLGHRALDRRLRRHVLGRRPDRQVVELRVHLAGERVEVRDLLDLVAEERDAVRGLGVRRLHLEDVALHPEAAAAEDRVVADVLRVDQLSEHVVAVVLGAELEVEQAVAPLLRRAEAVDARDRRDDDDVAPGEERGRRREPQPRDVVVLRGVLLDVEVGLRDVRLGLVVVVVRDEVLDGVRREELAELVAELRRQRLVVRDHERGLLDLLDDPGHRRRLAGAGRAEQRLVALARAQPGGESLDRVRLVARGCVRGRCLQRRHRPKRTGRVWLGGGPPGRVDVDVRARCEGQGTSSRRRPRGRGQAASAGSGRGADAPQRSSTIRSVATTSFACGPGHGIRACEPRVTPASYGAYRPRSGSRTATACFDDAMRPSKVASVSVITNAPGCA